MKRKLTSPGFVTLTGIALLLIMITGCKSYFIASDFEQRTSDHKTFAVLPFEMVFTGVQPAKLTEEDIALIKVAESKAFMISFYNEVLRSTKGGSRPIRVNIQHFDKTLSLLQDHNMDIEASWREDPGKLAEILGVDAVIKGRIQKHRLMSDLASYGIDMGIRIINILSSNEFWPWVPGGATTSNEVNTSYSLLDSDGTVLWSIAYDMDADWRQPADEVIENINRKSVKNFPYRMR